MAKWTSTKFPDGCLECGTTDKTHIGRGLCSTCYQREARGYEMETNPGSLEISLGFEQTSLSDNVLGDSGLV